MYRVQAIILYRQTIRDNQSRTILFSQDFGKITTWEKGNQGGDIGSTIEALIERIRGQNHLKKIEILNVPSLSGWSYEEVAEYLYIFQMLYSALPDGVEHLGLYRDIHYFTSMVNSLVGKVCFITYLQARIMKKLGYLDTSRYSKNILLSEFYTSTLSGSMKSMLLEGSIPPLEYSIIRSSILDARHSYSYRN